MEKKILENLFKIGGNVLEGWRSFYSSKKLKLLKSKLKDQKNTTFEQIEKVKTISFFLFLQIQMLAVVEEDGVLSQANKFRETI